MRKNKKMNVGIKSSKLEHAQQREAHSNRWKSSHGKSQSYVAWMAGVMETLPFNG